MYIEIDMRLGWVPGGSRVGPGVGPGRAPGGSRPGPRVIPGRSPRAGPVLTQGESRVDPE